MTLFAPLRVHAAVAPAGGVRDGCDWAPQFGCAPLAADAALTADTVSGGSWEPSECPWEAAASGDACAWADAASGGSCVELPPMAALMAELGVVGATEGAPPPGAAASSAGPSPSSSVGAAHTAAGSDGAAPRPGSPPPPPAPAPAGRGAPPGRKQASQATQQRLRKRRRDDGAQTKQELSELADKAGALQARLDEMRAAHASLLARLSDVTAKWQATVVDNARLHRDNGELAAQLAAATQQCQHLWQQQQKARAATP
ncbi:hypothetical protein HT031_006729 [Scenedesmus sp. PABB004]|nr:hypothetical protein HT031_006729 [Scenedesmus sp. PABB004]